MDSKEWKKHQDWEKDWWGDCLNTYNEETKQYLYSHFMGLDNLQTNTPNGKGWDLGDKSIIDIGSGPVSMLLKTKAKKRIVVDPCIFPKWVYDRYRQSGILYITIGAEDLLGYEVDEVWIYNVLQHTLNPQKIIENIKTISKLIRIFEWVDTGISKGHPHELKADKLDEWLGGEGKTAIFNKTPLFGKAYYGIFPGGRYEKKI